MRIKAVFNTFGHTNQPGGGSRIHYVRERDQRLSENEKCPKTAGVHKRPRVGPERLLSGLKNASNAFPISDHRDHRTCPNDEPARNQPGLHSALRRPSVSAARAAGQLDQLSRHFRRRAVRRRAVRRRRQGRRHDRILGFLRANLRTNAMCVSFGKRGG